MHVIALKEVQLVVSSQKNLKKPISVRVSSINLTDNPVLRKSFRTESFQCCQTKLFLSDGMDLFRVKENGEMESLADPGPGLGQLWLPIPAGVCQT